MRFQPLVLEGDKRAEKNMKEEFLPAYTKSAYSRRKLRERRPPLYNRSFYLCRMIEESLKGTELDGSGKIIVCAHHNRLVPGNETYLCDRSSHISIYHLEQEEIEAIDAAEGAAVLPKPSGSALKRRLQKL